MDELYSLKENLLSSLREYGKKPEISAQSLDVVNKLAQATKNVCKVIEEVEESDGMSMDGGSYRGRSYRRSYRGSYEGGGASGRDSYARGRGSGARRDSMGRYSSDGYSGNEQMVSELHELMQDAPDEKTRMEFQKFISKIESM